MATRLSFYEKNNKSLKMRFVLWILGDKIVNIRGIKRSTAGTSSFADGGKSCRMAVHQSPHANRVVVQILLQESQAQSVHCGVFVHHQSNHGRLPRYVTFSRIGPSVLYAGLFLMALTCWCGANKESSLIQEPPRPPLWAGAPHVQEAFGTAVAWNDIVKKERLLWHQISVLTTLHKLIN